MKKTLKKYTSILLVTLMLALSLPLQSFAAFEGIKIPVIEKIEVSEGSQAVSLKEVDRYYTGLIEGFEENGIDIEDLKENSSALLETMLKFHLYSSCFEYKFDVTLATGKEYTFSTKDYDLVLNKLYGVEIDAFITYENYLKAKEEGADEIQAEIYACLYNNLTYDYCYSTAYISAATLPLTEMVVKSITPVSGIPEKFYCDQDYVDIEGAEFQIEYADGRTVTATAQADTDSTYFTEYTLDGECVDVYYGFLPDTEEEATEEYCEFYFDYLDASCSTTAEYVAEPLLKAIKITDCVFDAENAYLSSLTYELTYKDGRTASFTKEFTELENPLLTLSNRINAVDGYTVVLYCSLGDIEEYGEKINADSYYFTVNAGEVTDTFKADNPYKDIMNGPLNVAYFFVNLFIKIQDFFYNLFDFIIFGF